MSVAGHCAYRYDFSPHLFGVESVDNENVVRKNALWAVPTKNVVRLLPSAVGADAPDN